MRWKKVTLVGAGLLGGSLGLALKRRRLAGTVVGFVRRAASVKECRAAGAVDLATLDLREAVSGADLIVLCTPLAQMRSLVEQMGSFLKRGVIVTDVGSVKGSVIGDLECLVHKAGGFFVGSHPMAGSEKAGVSAARADLFTNAVCVVTPTTKSDQCAVARVNALWKSVGGRLLTLTPEAHDKLVSRSSHLPHMVAVTLANLVLDPKSPKEQGMLCANGFRDTTRIASGSPEMWRDIALANRKNLDAALGLVMNEISELRRALRAGNEKAVSRLLFNAKKRRDLWAAKTASASSE